MKRNWMVPLLAALLMTVCSGLVSAFYHELYVTPGDVEYTEIEEASDVGFESVITSYNSYQGQVAHVSFANNGGPNVFYQEISLSYEQQSFLYNDYGTVNFPNNCSYYAHVNDTGTGYSKFQLTYPTE